MEEREMTTLHGHRVSYRTAGSGPLLVLIHGIAGSSATWEEVLPELATCGTVVAPDLLGHGQSAKPRTDYSLGAYASAIRDLIGALGYERGRRMPQRSGATTVRPWRALVRWRGRVVN